MGRSEDIECTITFLVSTKNINSASFNRFTSIAKASSINNKSRIIGLRPTQNEEELKKILLPITDNLFFYNFRKKSNKVLNLFKSYRIIKKYLTSQRENKRQKEILFIYSTNVIDYILYFFLSKKLSFKYITERNEYPTLVREKKPLKSFLYRKLLLSWVYKLFDGIILMTDPLIKYYSPYLNKKAIVVKIPMTVDFERFEDKIDNTSGEKKEKYIFYAGSLSQSKDGIETLIESFSIVHKRLKELKLKIAGGSQNEINSLSNKMKLNDAHPIEFLGTVDRDRIPNLINEASLLVLPRPESKQAEGGFPTKLGEYLASGNPIIATPVGDIPKYLTHNKDIFFCDNLNTNSFADCVFQIFEDYEFYKNIGKNGRSIALKHFSLKNYSKNLNEFYNSI